MPVSLAIAVCSRDRPDQLRRCLTSLLQQGADDLLVVDSASATDATAQVARELGVRCVREPLPGLARARNVALRATSGSDADAGIADIVAFTDDDCTAAPGWAATVRAAMDAAGDVGVLTGRVEGSGDGVPLSVHLATEPRTARVGDAVDGLGHGASLAVRRGCWDDVGGFDELLGAGAPLRAGEDTDLIVRAIAAGWTVRYEPDAVVVHEQWRGRQDALRTSFGYGVGAGAVAVKLRRLGPPGATAQLGQDRPGPTARLAATDLRAGYLFGAAVSVSRLAGIAAGTVRASRLPIDHGHLQPR